MKSTEETTHKYLDREDIEAPNYIGREHWFYELGVEFDWLMYPNDNGVGHHWVEVECQDWRIIEAYCDGPGEYGRPSLACTGADDCLRLVLFLKLCCPAIWEAWEAEIEDIAESEEGKSEALEALDYSYGDPFSAPPLEYGDPFAPKRGED